jgi:hypothetical protein
MQGAGRCAVLAYFSIFLGTNFHYARKDALFPTTISYPFYNLALNSILDLGNLIALFSLADRGELSHGRATEWAYPLSGNRGCKSYFPVILFRGSTN